MNERISVKDTSAIKIHPPKGGEKQPRYSSRSRIYVRAVQGKFETFRRIFGWSFIALFMLLPWLQYDDRQAVLLNFAEQRFNIFAITLWPQDLTVLAYIFIVAAFSLFFVTTFAGRVWCGFMCPQTAWTYIFITLEEKIEGARNKRIKLDERPMDIDKFWRKSLKHLSWLAVALVTALTFVGYFNPIDQLFVDFFTLQTSFWAGFTVIFFTAATYANAGWMREIVCLHMCPYARFQSAMFDKDTITVSYDTKRGESRGPRSRKATSEQNREKGLGDCIDCNLCVQVCPTGIDIRNGLQYECINCGACVDACDGIMDKMGYQKGLISYTSEEQLSGGTTHIVRPKLIGYALVLSVMISLLVLDIATRVPLEVDIIRDRGALYRETNEGLIENVYTLKVLNKSQREYSYKISAEGINNLKYIGPNKVTVASGEVFTLPISLAADPYDLAGKVTEIRFRVEAVEPADNDIVSLEPSKFLSR